MTKYSSGPERLFAALGDPTRIAVIQALCRRSETVSQLAAAHDMALPSFLQHLKVLEEAGWIRTTKVGRVRTCEIQPQALLTAGQWLMEQRAVWEKRLDQLDTLLYQLKHNEESKK